MAVVKITNLKKSEFVRIRPELVEKNYYGVRHFVSFVTVNMHIFSK
ncbi:hypothetical protein MHYMCMPSP_00523 [Hyalomma marginatum]|uniref:Uncharacterized protein n=1 Tax=Hyalomma marginatum TaxID=34627 RepID=A0A8S4C1K5_9ACAR|nr:hypothetical protein MHYMCMPASI_00217 [Hyalomma marginatum]CAG7591674.1 hypothetical protein MHYMCMPSP_00523 [Hyalomma marginatum]